MKKNLKIILMFSIVLTLMGNVQSYFVAAEVNKDTSDYVEAQNNVEEAVIDNAVFDEENQQIELDLTVNDINAEDILEINKYINDVEPTTPEVTDESYIEFYEEYTDSINDALDANTLLLIDDELYVQGDEIYTQGGQVYTKISLKGATVARTKAQSKKLKSGLQNVSSGGGLTATILGVLFNLPSVTAKILMCLIVGVAYWTGYAANKIIYSGNGMIMTIKPYGVVKCIKQ